MFNSVSSREMNLLPVFVYHAESYSHQSAMYRPKTNTLRYTQFTLCRKGSGVFIDDNNNAFDVNENDLFYFRHDTENGYEPSTNPWSVDFVLGGGKFLDELMDTAGFSNAGVIHLSEGSINIVASLFDEIISSRNTASPACHAINSRRLMKLIFTIADDIEAKKKMISSKEDLLALACVHYIEQHCSECFSITEIAENLNISATTLISAFKAKYNTTPQKYLTQTRISCAKNCLIYMKFVSLEHIAQECGFANASYFCTVFKKHTGMTPEEYRKANLYS